MSIVGLDGLKPYQIVACQGYGVMPADFMFVGISAGKRGALVTGVPLTKDASGRIFQRMLNRLGFSRSSEYSTEPVLRSCYITNLVKGRVLTEDGCNRLPTKEEIDYWWPTFEREVFRVNPSIIIALGELVYGYLKPTSVGHLVVKARHPRWYQAHGALNQNSSSFNQMVQEYAKLMRQKGWHVE